jgi:hypothetical protein
MRKEMTSLSEVLLFWGISDSLTALQLDTVKIVAAIQFSLRNCKLLRITPTSPPRPTSQSSTDVFMTEGQFQLFLISGVGDRPRLDMATHAIVGWLSIGHAPERCRRAQAILDSTG